jgi:hypothetical protein
MSNLMKIYVTNIPPSTIKLLRLDKFCLNKDGYKKYELASEEFGIHVIDYSKNNLESIYRIEPTLNMDLELIHNFNGSSLLVDKTKYVHIPVISQLPVDYILTKMTCFEYIIGSNKKNGLKLVVECLEETNEMLDKEMIPVNFYFVNSSSNSSSNSLDLVDNTLLEEINVFLLELN